MKRMRVIFETEDKTWRIVERSDDVISLQDLKGDCYDFEKSGYTGTREELEAEERDFERLVESEGVWGYELERWNPKPGVGYEHVDSCWGFVGQYSEHEERFKHYIVDELKEQIK